MELDGFNSVPRPNLEDRKNILLSEIRRLQQLPRASTYAQHRLKIADMALAILNKESHAINSNDLDELEKALQQLGI
jgi:hypothetical protein